MAHPDSIKVVVEDAANIAVTSAPAIGNVSVSPETPAVISVNTNSAQVTLAELIGGNPEDGQVIVYDATTNTFIYEYSNGGGALTSDLQVTNRSSAVGDTGGRLYEENDSHEGIIRDLLAPESPVISSAKLSWNRTSDGFVIPAGILVTLESVDIEFMFPERVENTSWNFILDGTSIGTAGSLPSDYGSTKSCKINVGGGAVSPLPHGSLKKFRIESTYDDNGVNRSYVFEDTIFAARAAFISARASADAPIGSVLDSDFTARITTWGAPSSEDSDGVYLTLKGSSDTENEDNYTWIAVPSSLLISSITEVVGDEGVANRTFSFSRVGSTWAYPLAGSDSYSVYLYRSNQKGALSSQSSLKIKLNRS